MFCTMPHPPSHIWAHPHDWSLQPLYLSPFLFTILTRVFSTKSNYTNIFPAIAQRSSNFDSLTCTSTAASIGDPSTCGVRHLREWPSTPITLASESDRGSSYASLSSSPMTASQSCEHHCLFGSHSSSWSIHLAPHSPHPAPAQCL